MRLALLLVPMLAMLPTFAFADQAPARTQQRRAHVQERQRYTKLGLGVTQLQAAVTAKDKDKAIKALRNLVIANRLERKSLTRALRAGVADAAEKLTALNGRLATYNGLIAAVSEAPKVTTFDRYFEARRIQDANWFSFKTDEAIEARAESVRGRLEGFRFGMVANAESLDKLRTQLLNLKASLAKFGGAGADSLVDEVAFDRQGQLLPLATIQANWDAMTRRTTPPRDIWKDLGALRP